ncbi:nuclease-related domain-containing protein [Streptomyces sp. NPDC048516]|uniref:nuclease-related domain-containing protein n=1 Tax=Streptomyces sp. NPDC048516 TaxID=3365565 RepID=UPI00371DA550
MTAGSSAAAWGREQGRLRWWQHLVAAVGVETPEMGRKRRHRERCEAGSIGEQRTHAMLQPLLGEGWHILPDRRVGRSANVDHVLVGPDGQVFTLDTKLWSGRFGFRVRLAGGRLTHGDHDRDRQVDTALWETDQVSKALGGVHVTPLIVVHNAPVDGGGFRVRGVAVFPADRLLELLRRNVGPADPCGALLLARLAEVQLPPR